MESFNSSEKYEIRDMTETDNRDICHCKMLHTHKMSFQFFKIVLLLCVLSTKQRPPLHPRFYFFKADKWFTLHQIQ